MLKHRQKEQMKLILGRDVMFKKTVRNAVIIAFAAVILLGGAAFSLNKSQVAKKVKVYENTETNKLHHYLSITRSFYSKKSESGMSSR